MRLLVQACLVCLCLALTTSAVGEDKAKMREKLAGDYIHCWTALGYWRDQFGPADEYTRENLDSALDTFLGAATTIYLNSGMTEQHVEDRIRLELRVYWDAIGQFDRSKWTNTIFGCGTKLSGAQELSELSSDDLEPDGG